MKHLDTYGVRMKPTQTVITNIHWRHEKAKEMEKAKTGNNEGAGGDSAFGADQLSRESNPRHRLAKYGSGAILGVS